MTHLILTHVHFDAATDAFIAAMSSFCHTDDSFSRVEQNVVAPKGSPGAIYLGRFADFDQSAFVSLVQAIPWDFVPGITGFIRKSGQNRFEPINLYLDYDIGRQLKLSVGHGWGMDLPSEQTTFFTIKYPQLMERRRELVDDSIRNPHRYFEHHKLLASVSMTAPWQFECIVIYPERRMTSSRRQEFGPGKNDYKMIETEHRMIYIALACSGLHVKFDCDIANLGEPVYSSVKTITQSLIAGDKVWVDGTIDVRNDGICVIEKIRSIAKATFLESVPRAVS